MSGKGFFAVHFFPVAVKISFKKGKRRQKPEPNPDRSGILFCLAQLSFLPKTSKTKKIERIAG